MEHIYNRINEIGIIPVIKLDDIKKADSLGKALTKGGIPIAEITFRTNTAAEAIKIMKKNNPDMVVGAGTVLTIKQADAAIRAGAEFIVSPGFNEEVTKFVQRQKIPMIPGAITPSEIEAVMKTGIHIIKFFPAEISGGLSMINALSAPYNDVKFIPTGGINQKNLNEYLCNDNVYACGGSWMVKSDYIKHNDFDTIKELCNEAIKIKEGARK